MALRDAERSQFLLKANDALAADRKSGRPPPRVLILCGIPGSGKSTFAKSLERYGWIRVNQDDAGSRGKCETQARAALLSGKDVVVDRCNFDVQQRKHWVDIGKQRGCPIGCIVFRVPLSLCLRRVQARTDHPTLKSNDTENIAIVRRLASMFVAPTPVEGIDFCRVVNEHTDMRKVSTDLRLY